jgi:hypothetical protein
MFKAVFSFLSMGVRCTHARLNMQDWSGEAQDRSWEVGVRNRLVLTSQWHCFPNHAFMLIYLGKFQLRPGRSNTILILLAFVWTLLI